jgi:hypothetical protein
VRSSVFKLYIESDSLEVLQLQESRRTQRLAITRILEVMQELRLKFDELTFLHIVAHEVAR